MYFVFALKSYFFVALSWCHFCQTVKEVLKCKSKNDACSLARAHVVLTCFLQWLQLLDQSLEVTGSGWHEIPISQPPKKRRGSCNINPN